MFSCVIGLGVVYFGFGTGTESAQDRHRRGHPGAPAGISQGPCAP